ncbi:hypothetical protein [Thiolinea disciformis]|uniref:hypothetical protein n=1 Tax=Thiolinea disciformis TaxID=125614 RepID=UPI00037B8CD3|nr:hypothetical protein [Thiolinea disciformis]
MNDTTKIALRGAADLTVKLPHAACASAGISPEIGGKCAEGAFDRDAGRDASTVVQDSGSGAEVSNTAPANCTNHSINLLFQLWYMGIDSLYLSFKGQLKSTSFTELDRLKQLAQSPYPEYQAQAHLSIANHHFEVSDRGQGKFRYVLIDNWFRIQIASASAKSIPCLYVQLSSEVLTLEGLEPATNELLKIVAELTENVKHIHVSRVDICVDFSTNASLASTPIEAWVTRSTKKDIYYTHNQLSGWLMGKGGDLLARIYDKSLEIKSSHKPYFKSVWREQGWSGQEPVWRVEFQYKREVLTEMDIHTLGSLKARVKALWEYASQDWLRLTIPNCSDQTITRWPAHPLWQKIQAVDWHSWAQREQMDVPIRRASKNRRPSDQYLFKNSLAFLSSYMAREGITDINTAYARYLEDARTFHQRTDTPLNAYIHTKRNLKAKSYNQPKAFDPLENEHNPLEHIPLPGDEIKGGNDGV